MENKSVFGCPEVQQRCDSAKGECGDIVCQVKRTLTKDTVCINEDKLLKKNKDKNTLNIKKTLHKNKDDLTQKMKMTSPKKKYNLTQKMKTIFPQKGR